MQISRMEPIEVLKVGRGWHNLVIDPKTDLVYLANNKSNSIQVIDGSSDKIVNTITIERPRKLVLNPNENKLYIISGFTDYGHLHNTGSNISIVDTLTNKLTKQIGDREGFSDIELHPSSNLIYATATSSKNLIIIDCQKDKIVDKIGLNRSADSVGINPLTNKIYIGDLNSFSISVLDLNKKIILKTICVNANAGIAGILVDTKSNRVYFRTAYSWSDGYGAVHIEGIEIISGIDENILDGMSVDPNDVILVSNPTECGVYYCKTRKNHVVLSDGSKDIGYFLEDFHPTTIVINPNTYKLYMPRNGVFKNLLYVFKDVRTLGTES